MPKSGKIDKLRQIMELAVEVNKGKPSVFVYYFGHTEHLQVDIHFEGWDEDSRGVDMQMNAWTSDRGTLDDFDKIIEELEKLKAKENEEIVPV